MGKRGASGNTRSWHASTMSILQEVGGKVRVESARETRKRERENAQNARPGGQKEFARVHSRGEEGIRLTDNRASHVVLMSVSADSYHVRTLWFPVIVVVVLMKIEFDLQVEIKTSHETTPCLTVGRQCQHWTSTLSKNYVPKKHLERNTASWKSSQTQTQDDESKESQPDATVRHKGRKRQSSKT